MAEIDYEVEYNNRARVPENPALMAGWAKDAAAYRLKHAPRSMTYGPGRRNVIDVFAGDGQGPIAVFIHGGYWQALDGSSFSHCARGLNAHGVDVAVPTYDLCPQVSIDTIIQQMRAVTREQARDRPADSRATAGHDRDFIRKKAIPVLNWRNAVRTLGHCLQSSHLRTFLSQSLPARTPDGPRSTSDR